MSTATCAYCGAAADDDGNRICNVCFMAESDGHPPCEFPECGVPGWVCGDPDDGPTRRLCANHAAAEGYCYACGDHVGSDGLTPTTHGWLSESCLWVAEDTDRTRPATTDGDRAR